MKKHYTHLFTFLLITLTNLSFAQVDWAIKSIKSPTELESTPTGTAFDLIVECENKGNSKIKAGDTASISMLVIDKETSTIVLEFPENASRGAARLYTIQEDIEPGETQDFTVQLTSNRIVTQSRDMLLGVYSYVINRTNPSIDSDSTNNLRSRDIVWWNQQKWNVSVEDIAYNSDNIAIYPNPANDQLNVSLLFAKSNAVNIELFDLTGKAVASPNMNQTISPSQYTLDVADLNKGVYILKVTNGTKVSTSKVTISH
jgi:hypothetical protein